MINEENLNNMYEGVINNKELTTKELNSYGFNSKDLAALIKIGSLERIKRGYYSFTSVENLYYYGQKLISMGEYEKAISCFEKYYELDPKYSGTCFYLFLVCIQSRNYEKAFEYFDHICNHDNKYYNADRNYYLYLLSMVTELPENYRQYAKSLKLEDIIVDCPAKRYNGLQNRVRILSLNQRFGLASKKLNWLIKKSGRLDVQNSIIGTLLNQAIEEQEKAKKNVIKLINEKRYEEVIEYLETLQERHNLSYADKYILSLTKDLIDIEAGKIPEKQISSTDRLFEAIQGKDYELALSLSKEYIEENNINPNGNAMFMLLKDITELIQFKGKIDQGTSISKPIAKDNTASKLSPLDTTTESTYGDGKITSATVISYLMKNDLVNSFITLRNYLDSIGKKQYEFLIIDLIKISLLEGDIAFTKPMIALTYVARENFEFNISEYIQNFYENLAQNKFDSARVYLDIISKSNQLGQTCILTEGLEQVLNHTERMLNYRQNNEILNKVEQSIQNSNRNSVVKKPQIPETSLLIDSEMNSTKVTIHQEPLQQKERSISKAEITQLKNKEYDDHKFINQKLEQLYEKGIILLKPMDSDRRKGIHDIVKTIPDVVSFSIGSGNSRQIVLRFKLHVDEFIDWPEIAREGNAAYKSQDYDLCIEKYRQLLKFGNPKAWVYAKLGLAYMKKFDKDTAIDYLTIATGLANEEQSDYDFTQLIALLKGMIDPEDMKTRVRMTTDDFENGINNYYGIEGVEQVAELISSGITIDDACLNVGLDEEQKNIISLIFARECYAQENYTMGDQFLKKVERSKNKSKFTKSLLDEVRRNKKFYKNRAEEGQKYLVEKVKK